MYKLGTSSESHLITDLDVNMGFNPDVIIPEIGIENTPPDVQVGIQVPLIC
jgi:hypothetical protein